MPELRLNEPERHQKASQPETDCLRWDSNVLASSFECTAALTAQARYPFGSTRLPALLFQVVWAVGEGVGAWGYGGWGGGGLGQFAPGAEPDSSEEVFIHQ